MKKVTRTIFGVLLSGLVGFSPAWAEWYVAGYAGYAFPNTTDRTDRDIIGGVFTSEITFKDITLEDSAVFGGKIGYFFETGLRYFALEVDGYRFNPDARAQIVTFDDSTFLGASVFGIAQLFDTDITLTGIGVNGVARAGLAKSPDFPKGRFQPYAGVGPTVFIANLDATTASATTISDTDFRVGAQAVAGLKFFLFKHVALFTEYKFIKTFDFNFELVTDPAAFTKTDLAIGITSHLIYGGLAFHF
ncbi:MAG: outer membrane protein [Candidatus Methylomirabilales bacterium]